VATVSEAKKSSSVIFGDSFLNQVFEKEEGSPFADGYSIDKEQQVLQAFITAGASEDDPLYERYLELQDRRERLEQMQRERDERRGADAVVSVQEGRGLDDLGGLVDDGVDQMTIHTIEAYRMFMGRSREPGSQRTAIIGGKRVASSLRNLWMLTINDNPYADWALVRHEHSVEQVIAHLRAETEKAQTLLNSIKQRGLSFSVLSSSNPMSLNLGFRSPYGYSISMLMVEYDYFVRIQKTLQRKNMRTDGETRKALSVVSRGILGIFYGTTRFDRWLNQPQIRELSRIDWVSEDKDAAGRVEFASQTFGPVPSAIYTCEIAPKHSRRRYSLTESELELLQAVGLKLQATEEQGVEPEPNQLLDQTGA